MKSIFIFIAALGINSSLQAREKMPSLEQRLVSLKKQFAAGDLSLKPYWQGLGKIQATMEKRNEPVPALLYLEQASLLTEAKYPIMAMTALSQTLERNDPKINQQAWELVLDLADNHAIAPLISDLLVRYPAPSELSEQPGWFYFLGEAESQKGHTEAAEAWYVKVPINHPYYLSARYALALSQYRRNEFKGATKTFQEILNPDLRQHVEVRKKLADKIYDYAEINFARLLYEQENFLEALKHYRSVRRESPLFYDALFEQAWAFFMAGYPRQGLGALYSAESPYFPERFNPEVSLLRALQFYWMCRYDDARTAVLEFNETYAESVNRLDQFLTQKQFNEKSAYLLFENLMLGVSTESLGIDRELLMSVVKNDEMRAARNRLADVVAERERLRKRGVFGSKKLARSWLDSLKQVEQLFQDRLGKTLIEELASLSRDFSDLKTQSEFLSVELLMSEKEKLLGRELHADSKLVHLEKKVKKKAWGTANQSWATSEKGEFWMDEIGYYVYEVQPLCLDERRLKE